MYNFLSGITVGLIIAIGLILAVSVVLPIMTTV